MGNASSADLLVSLALPFALLSSDFLSLLSAMNDARFALGFFFCLQRRVLVSGPHLRQVVTLPSS